MKSNKFLFAIFISAVMLSQTACKKYYSFEGAVNATGSLIMDAANSCIATANGSYNLGAALTSDNYIMDSVNVTSPGNYIISSDTVNGIWFRATGKFNNAGRFAVQIQGFGTPATSGDFNYTLTFDSSSCSVEVLVFAATTPTPPPTPTYYINATIGDSALTFNNNISDSAGTVTHTTINININNSDTTFDTTYTYTTSLTINGLNTSTKASYTIVLTNQLNAIATGTYTNTDAANIANCTYTDGSGNEYVTDTSQPFTVTVTSVTSSAISGTFSGTLISTADATKTITVTNGSFNVPSQ